MLDNNQNMLSDDDLDSVSGGTGCDSGGGHYSISSDCIGCGKCKDACPAEAIKSGSPYKINQGACVGCGACIAECPVEAIS